MAKWKMPPIAKVYEALSAVADGRVRIAGPARAQVVSSSGDKTYTVEWSDPLREITSDDNASYWQGYAGYPIIAVLLATGRITYDPATARRLAGVPWRQINDRFKRDYDRAVESVLDDIAAAGGDRAAITREAEAIYRQLEGLELERGPRRAAPKAPAG